MNMNIQRKFDILSECSGADPTRPNIFDLNLQIVAKWFRSSRNRFKGNFPISEVFSLSWYKLCVSTTSTMTHAITASLPQNLSQITRYIQHCATSKHNCDWQLLNFLLSCRLSIFMESSQSNKTAASLVTTCIFQLLSCLLSSRKIPIVSFSLWRSSPAKVYAKLEVLRQWSSEKLRRKLLVLCWRVA